MGPESTREAEDRREYRETVEQIFELLRINGERLVRVETSSESMGRELKKLNVTVDEMRINGCALGARQSKDIADLQERPARTLATVAVVSGIISSLVALIWRSSK